MLEGRCIEGLNMMIVTAILQLDVEANSVVFVFAKINGLFYMNIPNGFLGFSRYKREEELEYFMTKKYNSLGAKITAKTATLNNLVTNQDLRLI